MTLKIKNALTNTHSFSELLSIAEQAKPQLSFWATKSVSICGSNKKLPIHALAQKTIDMIRENIEFSEEERKIGKEIVKLIDKIYEDSKHQLEKSNFFTRLIHILRTLWISVFVGHDYDTEFYWEMAKNSFDYYTKTQYQKVFGQLPTKSCDWGNTGYPDRWRSPEAARGRQKIVTYTSEGPIEWRVDAEDIFPSGGTMDKYTG